MTEDLKEKVTAGILGKLQPWQAIFAVLSYVITQFDLSVLHNLIVLGMLCATLSFAMVSKNKHTEAMKEVIVPFVVDELFRMMKPYFPVEPVAEPSPIPEPIVIEKIVEVPVDRVVYMPAEEEPEMAWATLENTTEVPRGPKEIMRID